MNTQVHSHMAKCPRSLKCPLPHMHTPTCQTGRHPLRSAPASSLPCPTQYMQTPRMRTLQMPAPCPQAHCHARPHVCKPPACSPRRGRFLLKFYKFQLFINLDKLKICNFYKYERMEVEKIQLKPSIRLYLLRENFLIILLNF
jgi:hypothetical protein